MAKVRHFCCFGLTVLDIKALSSDGAFCFYAGERQAIAALRANYSRPEVAFGHVEFRRCVICCCFGLAVLDIWRPVSNRRTLFYWPSIYTANGLHQSSKSN
jgi:hypothetical protein